MSGRKRAQMIPVEDTIAERRPLGIDRSKPRVVVPSSLKAFILTRHHGLGITGHPGRTKTYAAIKANYHWDGLYGDVKRWIDACRHCCRKKTPRPIETGSVRTTLTPHPFHTVSVDIQGPLPLTTSGNRYLLTMIDLFTRWPIVVPIPNQTGAVISDAIFRHLLTVHGSPTSILTDRGLNFIKGAVKHLCQRWAIRKIETTGYQPQANPVERFHRYPNEAT